MTGITEKLKTFDILTFVESLQLSVLQHDVVTPVPKILAETDEHDDEHDLVVDVTDANITLTVAVTF